MLFSHARTALKHGLTQYKLGAGDFVLLPDYVCDALIQPLRDLGVQPVYFPIDDRFDPNWSHLHSLLEKNVNIRAIIMVHFFGQPQKIDKFQSFCQKYNLILIEDNAHGFGGEINGNLLGSYGNISITSHRKIFNTRYGASVSLNNSIYSEEPLMKLSRSPSSFFYWLIKTILIKHPGLHITLNDILKKRNQLDNPLSLIEPCVESQTPDLFSSLYLQYKSQKARIEKEGVRRRAKWELCEEIVKDLGFTPVFSKVHFESVPWMFPFYTDNKENREQAYLQLLDRSILSHAWPILPEEVVLSKKHTNVVQRWERLLCIPL